MGPPRRGAVGSDRLARLSAAGPLNAQLTVREAAALHLSARAVEDAHAASGRPAPPELLRAKAALERLLKGLGCVLDDEGWTA